VVGYHNTARRHNSEDCRWRQLGPLKRWYPTTTLHSVTVQKTKYEGSLDLWNVGILPQHYTAWQPRRLDLNPSRTLTWNPTKNFLREAYRSSNVCMAFRVTWTAIKDTTRQKELRVRNRSFIDRSSWPAEEKLTTCSAHSNVINTCLHCNISTVNCCV